ncbi:GTPase [Chondromyces apiculatus]|uniref:GTP-binding protein RBG1/RBG2 n=1 Tax=Chondromyces apiculatus DSM 436 TaxID=1192034 RepID=A0A017T359_9BACT|nr:GTPase [Chondromyces apiculatus]EYF03663.1 GTP-binding protein RBG1/RBG2 [Chondromyces apiculatus DSM 436]
MPANLSPEYKAAEAAYRKARAPDERLVHLREMLRVIPRHKGTEHLQADLKTRIKELGEALSGPKKGARTGPPVTVRPEGAAQVALLGPPNAGKSRLHARLTGSGAESAPYPFTTRKPQPGMLPFEDISFQLVDLPPISATAMESWVPSALTHADAALLVLDIRDPAALDDLAAIARRLAGKHIRLVPDVLPAPVSGDDAASGADDDLDGFHLQDLPTLLVATMSDLLGDTPDAADAASAADAELQAFTELTATPFCAIATSAETGAGLDLLGPWIFRRLGILRVYTKVPGQPPDMQRPLTLREGDTVADAAGLVHRGLAGDVKSARLFREPLFRGQHVPRDHALSDGDIIELHW